MQQINLDKNLLIAISNVSDGNIDFRFGSKSHTTTNRVQLFEQLDISPTQIIEVEQIHGSKITTINEENVKKFKTRQIPQTDGMITSLQSVALMIRVADCIPFVLYDPQNHAVALVHTGWRGSMQKIYLNALITMINHYKTNLKHVKIYLGPAIQSCCYKTLNPPGQRVLPEWQPFIKLHKKSYHIDFVSFVINNLISLGLSPKNITNSGQCTYHSPQWFSYQRHLDTNQTNGRFAVITKLI